MNDTKKKTIRRVLILAIAVLSVTGLCFAGDAKTINLITSPFGAGSYVMGSAMEEIVRKNSNTVRVSHSESPGVAYNLMKLERDKDAQDNTVFVFAPLLLEMAQRGMKPFKKKMGLNVLTLANFACTGRWMATRDASIKSYLDLKGKSVALGNKQQSNWGMVPFLEITKGVGLSPKDVNMKWLGIKAAAAAFKDRQMDVCVVGGYFNPVSRVFFPAPFFQQLLATEKGLHYVGPGEKAIAQLEAKMKLPFKSYTVRPGEVQGLDHPITVGMNTATWNVFKQFPENLAYELTKVLIADVGQFAKYHALGKILTKEMLCWGIPKSRLHPGAYRAYKEAGLME